MKNIPKTTVKTIGITNQKVYEDRLIDTAGFFSL